MTPVAAVTSATPARIPRCQPVKELMPGHSACDPPMPGSVRTMQTNQLSPDTLRRLAELRPADGKVVSIYLNLDPPEFASGPARATAINSVLDEAGRAARQEKPAVREDVDRVREAFRGFDFQGAHAVAV